MQEPEKNDLILNGCVRRCISHNVILLNFQRQENRKIGNKLLLPTPIPVKISRINAALYLEKWWLDPIEYREMAVMLLHKTRRDIYLSGFSFFSFFIFAFE